VEFRDPFFVDAADVDVEIGDDAGRAEREVDGERAAVFDVHRAVDGEQEVDSFVAVAGTDERLRIDRACGCDLEDEQELKSLGAGP
jgi:hypothetical protein